jgi:hypothetical protein
MVISLCISNSDLLSDTATRGAFDRLISDSHLVVGARGCIVRLGLEATKRFKTLTIAFLGGQRGTRSRLILLLAPRTDFKRAWHITKLESLPESVGLGFSRLSPPLQLTSRPTMRSSEETILKLDPYQIALMASELDLFGSNSTFGGNGFIYRGSF